MTAVDPPTSASAQPGYNAVARLLHWSVAGAIVVQYVLAKLAERADENGERFQQLVLLANHKSVGLTILAVALLRLVWRFRYPPPPAEPVAGWQRLAAAISHSGLYVLLLLMPLTGWLMSSASNIPVSWFNLFQLPDFVAASEDLANLFQSTHQTMAKLLFVLAVVHMLAALKHAVINRDRVLQRMTSPVAVVVFVLIIAAGVLTLIPESRAQDAPPVWKIDHQQSYIRFEAEQAGARFAGEWSEWQAELRFDPSAPEAGSFDVAVSVSAVSTGDAERDETLQDAEFFAADAHPLVRYRATLFETQDDATLRADGVLEIKGNEFSVPLSFTVKADGSERVLEGSTRLDRLRLKVGTNEWEDTAWIGQYVDVTVRVVAEVE